MKTVHATVHGLVSTTEARGHRRTWTNDAHDLAENTAYMADLLVCQVVVLWALLTTMYFAPCPVS